MDDEAVTPADQPPPREQDEALAQAKQAASSGDPLGMIKALNDSAFLDGMKRTLVLQWSGQIPEDEVEECIAVAVDKAYAELWGGGRIRRLDAWLWKVAKNKIVDRWRKDYRHRDAEADVFEQPHPDPHPYLRDDDPSYELDDRDRDELRATALKVAREILPTLGQENIVKVMTYVLDAIEADVMDLTSTDIGEALDLNPATVRKLIQRGFERMAKAARDRGYHLDTDQLPRFDADDVED